MKRASYRDGVAWIAMNDEDAETDPDAIRDQVSVVLLADIFGVDPERVARDVIQYRKKHPR